MDLVTPTGDGEALLSLSGRLDPHPWIETAGPQTAEDAFSVCRARVALMGWDTTFSNMPGERQELFGLLDAHQGDPGSNDLLRVRVQPAQPAAVHRYLPVLGIAVQDTLARLGVADVTAVLATLPAAPPDPQSLPYLQHTRNWFRATAPGADTSATLRFEGPTTAQQRIALERLAGRTITPFAIDPERTTIHLPEWSVTALTWTLATITTAVREAGFTDDLNIDLSPTAAASRV